MFSLVIQTLLLMAIAFILGAVLGCLLRNLFGSAEAETPSDSVTKTAAVGAVGAGAVAGGAAAMPKVPPAPKAPEVPKPPVPEAPERPVEKPEVVATPPAPPEVKKTPRPEVVAKATPAPKAKKAPAKKPPAKPQPAAADTPDNLKLIRGIGPQNEARLNALGVDRFAQIAGWKKKDAVHYGEALAFPGRIEREEWVKQAKVLAKGGTTKFSKRVKSGEVESSIGTAKAVDMGKKPAGLISSARSGKADDLTAIDGVGPAIEKKLNKLGVYHFDQIAKMTKPELAWLGTAVGFPGRPEREGWTAEAKTLASGGASKSGAPKRSNIKPGGKN